MGKPLFKMIGTLIAIGIDPRKLDRSLISEVDTRDVKVPPEKKFPKYKSKPLYNSTKL